jgi:hypothetical protein
MARQVKWTILVAIVFLSGLWAVSPMARAQEDHPAHSKKPTAQKGGGMMCPMMACLGDIKVFVKDAPEGPLSMTQVCMMRSKAMMKDGKQGQMCPMCMKMMHGGMMMHQKMRHGKNDATD